MAFIFMILGLICFIIDAFAGILGISSTKIGLQSLGLAFWICALLFGSNG